MQTETISNAELRPACPNDLAAIERLLNASGLPIAGVREALDGFVVAEHERELVGVIGLEVCCNYGLLRSTAVAPEWRGRGLGRQLVERVIADAESRGINALYLLTTTAERYFPSFGFVTTPRTSVPAEVQGTVEFQSACPVTATCMKLGLGG
jgi:amino-acid N-acetyltransferase